MLIKAVNTLLRLSPQQLKGKKMAAKTSKKLAGVAPKTATKKGAKACASSKKPATAAKEAVEPKKACCKKGKCSDTKLTRVIVKFDAGWGNQLYIRGIGAGLNWQKGIVMQCVGDDEWLWEQIVSKGDVSFKILLNDEVWSQGEDYVVACGDTIICHPTF